jgi:hypothetical protein
LNDWNLSGLSSLGFRPQHIDRVHSAMSIMQASDKDGSHKATLYCDSFLKALETHTRKIHVDFLKRGIVGVDFIAAGEPLHVQGSRIEKILKDLALMNAHAELKGMLEHLTQALLFAPQRKIDAAVQSPDPTSYRPIIAHSLQLLQLAHSIPSLPIHEVNHDQVLNNLRRSEQSKLKSHLDNARSSISARLKEFRAECQNPVELPPGLKAAMVTASSQDCLASIHAHLGYASARSLMNDLADAQRNLDSVETIYTPDATRYPVFSEFKQFLGDIREEVFTSIEHFEVVCTADFEAQKLFQKLSKLWEGNPRVLLDTKDKTINSARDGLTESDWSAIDEIERKGMLSDSKAPLYAERHRQFIDRFQTEALDRILGVASHDIADHCERLPEWLSRRRALSSGPTSMD